MKYIHLLVLIGVFWMGRQSVNSTVTELKTEILKRQNEYSELSASYDELEKASKTKVVEKVQEKERAPASVKEIVVQAESVKQESFKPVVKEEKKELKEIPPEQVRVHLERVMKYVEYLAESDSGTIISFLKQQKAPNEAQYKDYNSEIDSTMGKVSVRCEAYMNDCFDNEGQWSNEQEEVVYCATQFSHCLKNDQYQEMKRSEKEMVGQSM